MDTHPENWMYIKARDFGYPHFAVSQGGRRRMAAMPSVEDLQRFLACSPAAYVDRVKAPMCFLLGAKDRRVVMTDARLYLSRLRSRGAEAPPTHVAVFPDDTHALDRPQTEFECFLTHAWWFKRHMLAGECPDSEGP